MHKNRNIVILDIVTKNYWFALKINWLNQWVLESCSRITSFNSSSIVSGYIGDLCCFKANFFFWSDVMISCYNRNRHIYHMNSEENLLIFLFNFMFLIKSNTCTILTKPICLQVKNQEGFKGWKRIWLVKNYIFRIVIKANVAIICVSCEIKLRKSLAWLFQNSDANS